MHVQFEYGEFFRGYFPRSCSNFLSPAKIRFFPFFQAATNVHRAHSKAEITLIQREEREKKASNATGNHEEKKEPKEEWKNNVHKIDFLRWR